MGGEKGSMLAEVNRNILDAARGSVSGEQIWEFFCECGRDDCRAHVRLSIEAYAALHDGGSAVLADGHRVSQVVLARRLKTETEALTRQAEHQLRRARKNRPPKS